MRGRRRPRAPTGTCEPSSTISSASSAGCQPILAGKTIEEVGDQFDGDLLGDDPAATYRAALGEAIAAAEQPGVLGRTVHLSFGDVPGTEYLAQVTSDLTIHSWDLARGAGLETRLDRELVGRSTSSWPRRPTRGAAPVRSVPRPTWARMAEVAAHRVALERSSDVDGLGSATMPAPLLTDTLHAAGRRAAAAPRESATSR